MEAEDDEGATAGDRVMGLGLVETGIQGRTRRFGVVLVLEEQGFRGSRCDFCDALPLQFVREQGSRTQERLVQFVVKS